MGDNCVSLAGSTACPAFGSSSISTGSDLTRIFSFLSFVSDVQTFDNQLRQYIATDFARQKYQQQLGCSEVDLRNTSAIYARYTTSVICNAIVQNSIQPCGLSSNQSMPLCADTCAQSAISEQLITASPQLCGSPSGNSIDAIRADFTNCALPANSLSGQCVSGAQNEPTDCGYQANIGGLCSFCAASSPNATDSCCINSQVQTRCQGVELPFTNSVPPLFPSSTASASATASAAPTNNAGPGLSGGAIAGIVIGSVLGAALLVGLIIFGCILVRRRQNSQAGSIFNQPTPPRQVPPQQMAFTDGARGPDMISAGRVARMSALEDTSSRSQSSRGVTAYRRASSEFNGSNESQRAGLTALPKRRGSLSSRSALDVGGTPSSQPNSSGNEQFSSPEGFGSGQSEQLQFFKDYYSQDEIRSGDIVATLWAYQPRANDEFELERGDMLKIVGIWDDGWATGVRISERAEEWEARRNLLRDSGVSNASRKGGGTGGNGEIKAFPLVCVCLPEHWKKTIEGDTAVDPGTSGQAPPGASPESNT